MFVQMSYGITNKMEMKMSGYCRQQNGEGVLA